MTNTNFTEKDLSIETLFNNGVCLTYNPYLITKAMDYAWELKNNYCQKNHVKRAIIKSKAELSDGSFTPKFHYFSNGVLIHNFDEAKEKDSKFLQRVLKMLEIRNLPVNKICALQQIWDFFRADEFMREITNHANLVYPYEENFEIVPFPKLEDFVRDCFANGNVLLTASKDEKVNPQIRDCLALFADGRYYVSEECKTDSKCSDKNVKIFKAEHQEEYVFLDRIYVPKEYIAALYKEAEKYDWFIKAEDMASKYNRSQAEIQEMNRYIENLFATRKCLSVTNLENVSGSYFRADPDVDKYALFSDGLLVVSNDSLISENSLFFKDMCRIYKDMKLKIEKVPDYYIPAIYEALPKYQRSAGDIYMEMVKERAKKLKKELNVPHHQALDLAAKLDDWDDFQSIKVEDESHARYLISMVKWRSGFKPLKQQVALLMKKK